MRPCNQCGTPIDNSEQVCSACAARQNAPTDFDTPDVQHELGTTYNKTAPSAPHWLLLIAGAGLRGIPAAIVLTVASQIVTSFQMPLLTSCYIGLGVLAAYAVFGGLAELLPTGADNTG